MTDDLENLLRSALRNRADSVVSAPPRITPDAASRPRQRSGMARARRSLRPAWAALAVAAAVVLMLGVVAVARDHLDTRPAAPTPSPTVPTPAPVTTPAPTPSGESPAPSATPTPTPSTSVAPRVPGQLVAKLGFDIGVFDTATGTTVRTLYKGGPKALTSVVLGEDGSLYGLGSDPAIGASTTGLWRLPANGGAPQLLVRQAETAQTWYGLAQHASTLAFIVATGQTNPQYEILVVSTVGAIIRRIPYVPDPQDDLLDGVDVATGSPNLGSLDFLPDGTLAVGVNRAQYCMLMFLIDPMTAQTATEGRRIVAGGQCGTAITQNDQGIVMGVATGSATFMGLVIVDPLTLQQVSSIPTGAAAHDNYVENLAVSSGGVVLGDRQAFGSAAPAFDDSTPFYLLDGQLIDIPLKPVDDGLTPYPVAAHVLGWWPGS